MEKKKKDKVNLEKYSGLFFRTGIIIGLVLIYALLNWDFVKDNQKIKFSLSDIQLETEYLPPITTEKPKKPKPHAQYINPELINEESPLEESEPMDNGVDLNEAITINIPDIPKEEVNLNNIVFYSSEKLPRFPGGIKNLKNYIARHTNYPATAKENGIEGKVFIHFIIDEKGRVTNPKVIRSVDSLLDKEALKVISTLPNWKPGMNNGKPVKVRFTIPVTFKLQ